MTPVSQVTAGTAKGIRISMSDDHQQAESLSGMHIHMIGVGGSGMCGLAQIAVQCGALVTGSDRSASPATEQLEAMGVKVSYDQQAGLLPADTQWVICSAAVGRDNPERVAAEARHLKIFKYSEMLGRVMQFKRGVAIAGTHGKSTTTAMTALIMSMAGLNPSFVGGAVIPQLGGSSHGGDGEHFVAEACEFDRSFLNLSPQMATVLNVEPDHLDYYKDINDILAAFCQFVAQVHADGLVILPAQSPHLGELAAAASAEVHTFGWGADADIAAQNYALVDGCPAFDLALHGQVLGRVRLQVPGQHNVFNALAAAGLAMGAGVQWRHVREALESFRGIERRSELIGQVAGVTLVDDYAHHPTEIRATLAALKTRWQPTRLICVFQPHQHSRTRCFMDEFAHSFDDADLVIVPDIHFARDTASDEASVKASMLVEKILAAGKTALHLPQFPQVIDYLVAHHRPGDLIISMGAGSVWKVTHELAKRI